MISVRLLTIVDITASELNKRIESVSEEYQEEFSYMTRPFLNGKIRTTMDGYERGSIQHHILIEALEQFNDYCINRWDYSFAWDKRKLNQPTAKR